MEQEQTTEITQKGLIFGSTTTSFLSFVVFFIIIFQIYEKGIRSKKGRKKCDDPDLKNLPGLEVFEPIPCFDPTGIFGNVLNFLPFEKSLTTAEEYSKKFGSFRARGILQDWVSLGSGEEVQALCKSMDQGHLLKSPTIYGLMKPFVTNGVLVSKGRFWQHQRKILLKSQSYQSLKAYMPLLNRHSKTFVSNLEEMFKDGQTHQINDLINSSFIKVICEMITGYNNEQSEESGQYHHNFQIWKESIVKRFMHSWLLLPLFWRMSSISRKHDKAVEEMFDFARRRIREHKEKRLELEEIKNSAKCSDAEQIETKSSFRSVLDELVDAGVEEDQIIDEINTMLFGGHETGATAIHFFCFCMALNPDIQKECQREIDELFDDPSNYKNGDLTYDAITSNLKLLERCILETLRLFPPVFLFFRKLESPLKMSVKGRDVVMPAGTNAAVIPYCLHRKPEYFPEPEKFDPDRFLPEECAKRHAYSYVPFSAGTRNCLGLKFAMIEMKTIAAYILRHFSITTSDKIDDIPLLPFITLTPARDYNFQFHKRATKNFP